MAAMVPQTLSPSRCVDGAKGASEYDARSPRQASALTHSATVTYQATSVPEYLRPRLDRLGHRLSVMKALTLSQPRNSSSGTGSTRANHVPSHDAIHTADSVPTVPPHSHQPLHHTTPVTTAWSLRASEPCPQSPAIRPISPPASLTLAHCHSAWPSCFLFPSPLLCTTSAPPLTGLAATPATGACSCSCS